MIEMDVGPNMEAALFLWLSLTGSALVTSRQAVMLLEEAGRRKHHGRRLVPHGCGLTARRRPDVLVLTWRRLAGRGGDMVSGQGSSLVYLCRSAHEAIIWGAV